MSSASNFFKQSAANDVAFRMSQYRTIFNTGTNRTPLGNIPPGDDDKNPPKPEKIIAGETEAGGEEVAG